MTEIDVRPRPKIIAIDDDPTGSQTVHGCLLLMRWDVETLLLGLRDDSPIFFILANTRSMTPEDADATTREVCRNLKQAIAIAGIRDFLVVSRSDSTLRGHYPTETDAIAEELGDFDAHFMTPAFFEGGRFTLDSTHYLEVGGERVPTHETEFAKDSVFGYSTAYLPDYVAEKTGGNIPADRVERFLLSDVRKGCGDRLATLTGNVCVAVDAEVQGDLDRFATDVLDAAATGKRFLFRSAASLLTSLAQVGQQPIPAEEMSKFVRGGKAGAILIGSHVQKTTQQLSELLEEPGTVGVEVNVVELRDGVAPEVLRDRALETVRAAHAEGKTPAIYTSRGELQFDDIEARLKFGVAVSALLMDILRGLPDSIGFLVSKGGITSNDVLSDGLALRSARLLGQILAGCSVVTTADDHPQFPNLPVVLFPGNVGGADGLATVYRRFSGKS
ncbi:MAG: four-carbon acid sugar kinase family protein [Geitlerinemataceae cyanobacterium]